MIFFSGQEVNFSKEAEISHSLVHWLAKVTVAGSDSGRFKDVGSCWNSQEITVSSGQKMVPIDW